MFRVCGAACTVVALRDHTPMSLRRGVHCAWCAMSLFCCGGVLFGVLYVQAEGYWQRGAAYKGFAPGVTSFADVDVEQLQSVQEQPVYASLSDPYPASFLLPVLLLHFSILRTMTSAVIDATHNTKRRVVLQCAQWLCVRQAGSKRHVVCCRLSVVWFVYALHRVTCHFMPVLHTARRPS